MRLLLVEALSEDLEFAELELWTHPRFGALPHDE